MRKFFVADKAEYVPTLSFRFMIWFAAFVSCFSKIWAIEKKTKKRKSLFADSEKNEGK